MTCAARRKRLLSDGDEYSSVAYPRHPAYCDRSMADSRRKWNKHNESMDYAELTRVILHLGLEDVSDGVGRFVV